MPNIELTNKNFMTVLKENPQQLVDKILDPAFWGKEDEEMKFNTVVGNPPYQMTTANIKKNQKIKIQ